MTVNGNGNAYPATRSTIPSARAARSSSRPCTIARIRSSSRSTRRRVNAGVAIRRSRVWSGGSTASMCRASAGPGRPSATTSPLWASAACMSLDSRGSVERRAGLVVADDQPRRVPVGEPYLVHRAGARTCANSGNGSFRS